MTADSAGGGFRGNGGPPVAAAAAGGAGGGGRGGGNGRGRGCPPFCNVWKDFDASELVAANDNVAAEEAPALVRGGVYALRDAEGVIMRTGRTGDLARRAAEHARDPLLEDFAFDPVYRTDVYAEQRGLEQLLHDTYSPPLNKINPINPANPRFGEYMNAGRDYLNRIGQ